MVGYALYLLGAYGLGAYFPATRTDDPLSLGARVAFGGMAFLIAFPAFHVALGLHIRTAAWLVIAAAIFGLALMIARAVRTGDFAAIAFHPALVLPALVAGIAATEGVGYIPYMSDDFSNWIGVAKQIVALGRFDPGAMQLSNSDHLPGWTLALALPGVVRGTFHPADAALLPFVLHLGLVALLYDIVRRFLTIEFPDLDARHAQIGAWLFLLLFLAAEATGPMALAIILPEEPQVYATFVVFLALLMPTLSASRLGPAVALAATSLAAGYLVKAAGLTVAIAPLVLAVTLLFAPRLAVAIIPSTPFVATSARAAYATAWAAAILMPTAIAFVAWTLHDHGIVYSSPLAALRRAESIIGLEWAEVGAAYWPAVWDFATSYKVPVTVAAALGLAWATATRRYAVFAAAVAAYVALYLGMLYWYHLVYWGTELNSIPRFTRVPIRVAHAAGLTLLFVLVAQAGVRSRPLAAFVLSGRALAAGVLAVTFLGMWQLRAIDRTIIDAASRRFLGLDPVLRQISAEAVAFKGWIGSGIPAEGRLVVLVGGLNNEYEKAAYYHLQRDAFGAGLVPYRVEGLVATMVNGTAGATNATPNSRQLLRSATIIWPLATDAELIAALAATGVYPDCAGNLSAHFLVRNSSNFRCLPKRGATPTR